MANHDLALGQTHNLDHLRRAHTLGLSHARDLGLGQSHLDHNLGIGMSHGHDLDLRQNHKLELAAGQSHGIGLPHNQETGHELDLSDNHDLDAHALGLGENHELAIVPNLDIGAGHSQELVVAPMSGPQVLATQELITPIRQVRTMALCPSHEIYVGQDFPDVKSCRRALRDSAIALHFEIQTVKSDKTRFTAKCASEGCPWRVHAAKLPGVPTFTIRTIHEQHTCGGITHLGHQQASVGWVANSVEDRLRENPNYKPKDILEDIHKMHGITLTYKQAWRGKERIMAALRGSFEEGYRLLPQYCEQIKRTNPGSIASVFGTGPENCFQRLFVSFHASIYGFVNACRPLLGLDRTVLKSKYLGTLLFATGFDGEGALFPLAFGVVDEENDESWMWFLSELHNLLEVNTENMPRLTILSDRQPGIIEGVETNFPTAFHGFCMRQLSDSFRKEFNNPMLVNLLWEAAYALTVLEFEAKILEIEDVSQDAAFWIRRIPPRLWATAYFEGTRFGHLTANIVESLNSWISEASGLPIVQMMESVRRQLMTWFNERRETSMQWSSILVPSAERRVNDALQIARNYQVLRANEAEFEVVSHEGTNIVDIRNRCCLCRGWQLYGLPCSHAVAALISCRQNVNRFTESCFTVTNYRKTYSQTIHPVPDKTLWKELSENSQNGGNNKIEVVIAPPKSLRPPGRRRKKRVRSEDHGRVRRVVHCSRCNQTGHFRTTCKALASSCFRLSRLLAGDQNLARRLLDTVDTHNISFIIAARFAGYAKEQDDLSAVFLQIGYYSAFVELHIEQGPALEGEGVSIGIVTAIAAPASMKVTFEGNGGHAGAVLMPSRNDAGLAAAELALAVERHVLDSGSMDTVGTVGIIELYPGAVNSIPSKSHIEIDTRDIDERRRNLVVEKIHQTAINISKARGVKLAGFHIVNQDPPALSAQSILNAVEASSQQLNLSSKQMISRAYHDSLFMARISPMGMIFIPCYKGYSHKPEEYASIENISNGVKVLALTLARLSQS